MPWEYVPIGAAMEWGLCTFSMLVSLRFADRLILPRRAVPQFVRYDTGLPASNNRVPGHGHAYCGHRSRAFAVRLRDIQRDPQHPGGRQLGEEPRASRGVRKEEVVGFLRAVPRASLGRCGDRPGP